MKFYSIYKITNLLNNKIYIGFHTTNDLEDSYMGSNVHLQNSIKKYGINNFKKETLFIFDSYEAMVNKEIELVNEEFVKSDMTYNKNLGGIGGFYFVNQNYKKFQEKKIKSYQHTLDTTDLRQRISRSVKKYAEDNPEKLKEAGRKGQQTRDNKTEEEKEAIKQKSKNTLDAFYKSEAGILKREEISKKYTEYYNSEEGLILRKTIGENVKNSTFRDCFYNEYEKLKYDVLNLIVNSNLLDKDIKKLLKLPYCLATMLTYYERKGYIYDIENIKIDDISHSVIVKKTTCKLKTINLDKNFILYKYIREDYINLFLNYYNYIIKNYSDSYISNKLRFQNMHNVLKYMEYLNIITIEDKKQIDITWLNAKSKRKTALKTIITLNKNFKQDYKFINKENLDEYSITSSFNGENVSISWNKL